MLRQFAKRCQPSKPLPDELLARFLAARKFNQGFATVEFVSSALIDLEFHTQPAAASRDVAAFEKAELEKIGMPAEIALRHRPTQFGHIFSGDHYASGYYSYMWSEVMKNRRRLRRLRGGRRHLRSRHRKTPARRHLFVGRRTRPGRCLCRVSRPRAGGRRAVAPAGPARNPRRREVYPPCSGLVGLIVLAGGIALGAAPAEAHPHVWIIRQKRGGLRARRLDHGRAPRLDV